MVYTLNSGRILCNTDSVTDGEKSFIAALGECNYVYFYVMNQYVTNVVFFSLIYLNLKLV